VVAKGALAGVRVLDLIDGAGAYGPKLLAGFGADVIRVEPPGGSARRARPSIRQPRDGDGQIPGLAFVHYNTGKRGITLQIESQLGRDLLRRLLDRVDIVFDNGQLLRLGHFGRRDAGGNASGGQRPLAQNVVGYLQQKGAVDASGKCNER